MESLWCVLFSFGLAMGEAKARAKGQRRKVLFVASSLLEKYPSTAEGHSYVTDFLAVVCASPQYGTYGRQRMSADDQYTRISEEQHAALLEESAAPSREPSPGTGLAASS